MATSRAKLLFLLSNDYGELSCAVHFTTGCDFDVVMAAPARIYSANQKHRIRNMVAYSSSQELAEIVDRENPDIVFLCSGYLFAINQLFSIEEFASLIRRIRKRGCLLVTTDPFLGLMSDITPATFSEESPLRQTFTEHFSSIFEVIRDIIHIYLVDPRGLVRAPSLCAFNKNTILPPQLLQASNQSIIKNLQLHPEKRRWVFVLSTEDYLGQASRLGEEQFKTILIQKLQEAAGNQCQPVLIAPDACLQSIKEEAKEIPDLHLQPFFDFEVFQALLFEAEYAFYWNILSNSILSRVLNQKPVFFFGKGHLAHAIPPMYERAHQHYYAGTEMPFLVQQDPLTKNLLEHLAAQQGTFRTTIIDHFHKLPTPEQAVALLLQSRNRSA